MRWRGRDGTVRGRAAALAEQRLEAFAAAWRPTSAPHASSVGGPAAVDTRSSADAGWAALREAEPTTPPRARMQGGPWTRSALRGLALLVGIALVVAGYWLWTGRPRAVAIAPTVLATGAPVGGLRTVLTDPASAGPGGDPSAGLSRASPEPAASPDASVAAPAEVVVHVAGQVARPGLVRLPAGSRVADAVDAAGGVTRPRAADTVNLARVLVDGEQVLVGVSGGPAAVGAAAAPVPAVVDLNTASATELDGLPGIGPVIAARIVAWRVANGPFRSVDELGEVSGIGDAILAQVRPRVRL
jgi:competence protein ComEA